MSDENSQPPDQPADPAKPAKGKTGAKRTAVQVEADLLYIEKAHVQEGKTLRTIAKELSATRPYSITFSQISRDLTKLSKQWQKEYAEIVNTEKSRALKELEVLREEAMAAWHRSKTDSTRINRSKTRDARTVTGEGAPASREEDSVVKQSRDGDVRYIETLLKIMTARRELLGLDAPKKMELSGPGGAPIPVAQPFRDEDIDGVLDRFIERHQRKQADGNAPATATATPA